VTDAAEPASPLLSLRDVSKRFGGVAALSGVTFDVGRDEILGVIGPNGAGKTTLLNCISGVHRLDGGDIVFDGASIAGTPPHRVARLGIGRTFQVVRPFTSMTVRENAAVGALFGASRLPMARAFEAADEVLEAVGMAAKRSQPVASLTIPDRKRLEVARALATRPRLLLLDEVGSGLNHDETEALGELLVSLARDGISILLVEHDMELVMSVCDRIHVLDFGRIIFTGTPEQVQKDPQVQAAYLGAETA
jgi:branched-chain amino acid transport system ATP-binding protein